MVLFYFGMLSAAVSKCPKVYLSSHQVKGDESFLFVCLFLQTKGKMDDPQLSALIFFSEMREISQREAESPNNNGHKKYNSLFTEMVQF